MIRFLSTRSYGVVSAALILSASSVPAEPNPGDGDSLEPLSGNPGRSSSTSHGSDTANEWRSFREDELRQLERRRNDARTYSKFNRSTLSGLAPVASPVTVSTVEFLGPEHQRVCLGIVVDTSGHVLTKASEVATVGDDLYCRFAGGITVTAKVTDMFPPYDLALVKTSATGLRPVSWGLSANNEPGTIVAATGIGDTPLSFGVLSVGVRSLNPGFLGVNLSGEGNGAVVHAVIARSAALAAGIKAGDVIIEVEGEKITDRDHLIAKVKKFSPGDQVQLIVDRNGTQLEMRVMLGSRHAAAIPAFDPNHMMLQKMQVALSKNRSGYPSALQHDLPLNPDECGGPLVNLNGEVVGMNIARAGRIRTLAIPAADIVPLLERAKEGTFSIPDPKALLAQLALAREAVVHAEETLAGAKAAEANLERALDNLKKYRLPEDTAPNPPAEAVASEEKAPASPQESAPDAPPDGDGGIAEPQPIP